jgi:hypothetical protein
MGVADVVAALPDGLPFHCGLQAHPVRADSVVFARSLLQCGRAQTIARFVPEGVLMKKAVSPKKNKTAADVVAQKKPAKTTGPVELDLSDLKKVSGGAPKGGWLN